MPVTKSEMKRGKITSKIKNFILRGRYSYKKQQCIDKIEKINPCIIGLMKLSITIVMRLLNPLFCFAKIMVSNNLGGSSTEISKNESQVNNLTKVNTPTL